MTLKEFGSIIDAKLDITGHCDFNDLKNEVWSARFQDAEIKWNLDHYILYSVCGHGKNPLAAVKDYVEKIKGKVIVLNSMSANRRVHIVPSTLKI